MSPSPPWLVALAIVLIAILCTIAMIRFGTDSALLGISCGTIAAVVTRTYDQHKPPSRGERHMPLYHGHDDL